MEFAYTPEQVDLQQRAAAFTARLMAGFSRMSPVGMGAVLGVALMVINTLGPRGVAPFIYFKF